MKQLGLLLLFTLIFAGCGTYAMVDCPSYDYYKSDDRLAKIYKFFTKFGAKPNKETLNIVAKKCNHKLFNKLMNYQL